MFLGSANDTQVFNCRLNDLFICHYINWLVGKMTVDKMSVDEMTVDGISCHTKG